MRAGKAVVIGGGSGYNKKELQAGSDKQRMQKTLDEVRKLFQKDRFATENGAVVDEVGEGYAKCSLKLSDSHRNALGAVMGGAIFTLADFAFAVAANWQNPGAVSLSSNIAYLGTAKGEKLTAQAQCIKNGRTTSYYNIEVEDELGNQVAAVAVTGYRKPIAGH